VLEDPEEYWEIVEDARTGAMEMRLADGGGRVHFHDNDLVTYSQGSESYRIGPAELTSATGRTRWRYEMARGDWHISTETETMLTADATDFIVQARLRAWEGETLVHEQEWDERIPRMLV
jgi:hypothetical protein